jgi:hypothetical protein
MPNSDSSPFNWKATPSVFADDPAMNGINAQRARSAAKLKKTFFAINNKDNRTPFNQVNTYGRAVVAKTKESFEL